ncbi:hypothetical protein FOYG_12958 [Fusarium oxysporum NRRL 32931]|uniref:Uncharacterized protein n=1 Tax=Fusarium oxysporum NRRL 32931 TaxID=660029 RepID=W9HYJ7_FUSOX|nr:hypothetical protein FOYG_12958 [Fusarium oxysporum NRRL 32931]
MPGWILHNNRLQTPHKKIQNTVLAKACLQYVSLRQVWDGALHNSPHPLGVSFRRYTATAWHQHITSRLCSNPDSWRTLIDSEDPKLQGKDAKTVPPGPLYYAVEIGLKDMAISLITEQNVNEMSSLGRSPLGIAYTKGFIEVVKLMVQNRANITATDNKGWTPVIAASSNRHTPVYVASFNGHVEVVKLLLENGADITAASNKGLTPVIAASLNRHTEVVKLLLKNKADITVADNDGWTPVFAASDGRHAEVVKLLLENKANITVASNKGVTPVITASFNRHIEVVKLLLENGADITVTDNKG